MEFQYNAKSLFIRFRKTLLFQRIKPILRQILQRMIDKVTIAEKFNLINDFWSPHIIGQLNGQYVKLAKLKGDFVWHSHVNEDEYFQIFKGSLQMEFRDRIEVLNEGDMLIVPKGVEHNPHTLNNEECWVILFEPINTLHTGDTDFDRANNNQQWI